MLAQKIKFFLLVRKCSRNDRLQMNEENIYYSGSMELMCKVYGRWEPEHLKQLSDVDISKGMASRKTSLCFCL